MIKNVPPQPQGQTDRFLQHLVEDAKQGRRNSSASLSKQKRELIPNSPRGRSLQNLHFFRTAQPYKCKDEDVSPGRSRETTLSPGLDDAPLLVPFNFNDLFVWAVLQQRQQMALFLWQHGEEALARATVACKLYRSMAFEARQSSMDDIIAERFKAYSLQFGQLAVDVLDGAFRQNEQMAMKLLTSEMEAWSHFTCLQMAVSSCHRPFVSHSCTQTLLTDLWTGPLNMRKNSFLKIILSLLLPPAILLLEFKSKAEMCHVPQSHEAMLFGLDPVKSVPAHEGTDHMDSKDAERGLSVHDKCPGLVSETVSSMTMHCLSWITRLYEFYTAPVVKFWFHTVLYLAFLMLFSFVVLVKMEDQPSVQEWLVIVYILSTAVEKIREVLMSEPRKLSHKLKIWFSEYWNKSDFIAILLFLAGLTLRWHAGPYRTAGRIAYCLDIIFWYVRVTDLLAVNQYAGPYLTMITKMTSNMFFIVVMMAIVLLSFGVARKAILSPDEEPSWSLARDVVFQPYWMIYGEVYATEIDACDDGIPCPPASFLTPFLQAVYMFFQYIIMVNILIAFFNNIYFDMASTSNKLWKYNRYRYIMTYQERPWLPPPLILLSHMTLGLTAIHKRFSGEAEQEERGSGLKLCLGHKDRKKLHEFEEKCVQAYFHEKSEGLHSSQINQIRATAERAEEMCMIMGEVSEKVNFIQESLSDLDCQLGQLQDLSALAMDTLTLLSASDSLHQEETRLAQCGSITASRHILPHSWTLLHRSGADQDALNMRRLMAKSCKSTPPSLLKGLTLVESRRASQECHVEDRGSRGGRQEHTEEGKERAKEDSLSDTADLPSESLLGVSRSASHAAFSHCYGVHPCGFRDQTPCGSCGPSRCGCPLSPRSLESAHHKLWTCDPHLYPSQEETSMEEEEEEEGGRAQEQLSNMTLSRGSSNAVLLSDPPDISEGLVNPAFSQDNSQPSCRSRSSNQWGRHVKTPSPMRGSVPSLDEPMKKQSLCGERSFRDDTLQCNRSREWSKSSDFTQVSDSSDKTQNRKTVKIQESSPDTVLNPWICCRSKCFPISLQSGIAPEAKSSLFQSTDNLYPHYSAMERNNLMRLAHDIPFTPVSIFGGEEVSIYSLEEVPSDADPEFSTVSSWSSRGLSAMLQPLSTLCLTSLKEIQQQRAAQKMMQVFNQVKPDGMQHSPRFLDVSLVLWHSNGQWLTIERNMSGDFRKYNNNTGEEITPYCSLEEMLLAFSHWTYEYSGREMLVLDIQGVGEELTDPTVVMADNQSGNRGEMLFGPDNLGDAAVNGFRQKHSCGICCRRLGLEDLRKHPDRCENSSDSEPTSRKEE
ncbi:hypothetical protein F2P81_013551 [Scophthalmus maximus]|uniref:non-specific serine/threonine protein kinase n=1 Tax=Scophthalmus maximus TaxID=52904 RepID=A0A6A4SLP7_SCOMX|nr:hypothetical protein F2P81_013551 [Scophthalmus maximus]